MLIQYNAEAAGQGWSPQLRDPLLPLLPVGPRDRPGGHKASGGGGAGEGQDQGHFRPARQRQKRAKLHQGEAEPQAVSGQPQAGLRQGQLLDPRAQAPGHHAQSHHLGCPQTHNHLHEESHRRTHVHQEEAHPRRHQPPREESPQSGQTPQEDLLQLDRPRGKEGHEPPETVGARLHHRQDQEVQEFEVSRPRKGVQGEEGLLPGQGHPLREAREGLLRGDRSGRVRPRSCCSGETHPQGAAVRLPNPRQIHRSHHRDGQAAGQTDLQAQGGPDHAREREEQQVRAQKAGGGAGEGGAGRAGSGEVQVAVEGGVLFAADQGEAVQEEHGRLITIAFQNGQNSSYHLVQTPKSSTYLKQGKAHLRMLISGSMSLAMASSTIMFVSSVANSPSSFILFSRMMVSMSMKMCMPCRSSRAWLFSTLNSSVSCLWQLSNFPPRIFLPSKLDRLQMSSAHSSPRPSMTDLMKLTKFFLSFSLRVMTMPASMTLTTILSLYCLSRLRISCSSCLLSRYSLFIFSVLKFIDFSFVSIEQYSSLIESRISVRKLKDCSLISMKMLPPWQSAWMKLFFISISKKVLDPRRAITLLRGCLLDSQQVTGTPSTKVSMRTESLVFSSKGKGNLIYLLPLNISLKVLRFFISKVKSICSVRVRLRECSLTGISMAGEMKEARQLRKNSRFTSLSMYLSTLGCRTFTATFFPLQMALQTWLTEPDAMGTGSNDSKMSSMFLPQDSLKQPLVVSSECVGAFSRRYSNLEASSGPIMSLLWLRYWKALMKTTPDLSMAFTKRSIQQFCVRLKKSSGESRMGGMKISIRWKKRTTWMKACQILAQIDRRTPTAPSLDGFCSAGPTAAGLSSCRLTFPGMKARQAAAKRGSLAPLRRSWVLKAGRATLRRRDAAKPKLQWKRSR